MNPRIALPAICTLSIALLATGCGKKQNASDSPVAQKPKPKPEVSEVTLKSFRPNEAGAVMIVMYHRINAKEKDNDLNRTPDSFRKDLETLYAKNYRPVSLAEFIDNRMDLPAGKSPVVLTFDDSLPTQFKMAGDKIDPDCAVGIMEDFAQKHPDWKTRAAFFVLPEGGRNPAPFGQPDMVEEKLNFLVEHGYEVSNHSTTHSFFGKLTAEKVQWELGNAAKQIRAICPKAQMDFVALPYGSLPKKDNLKYLEAGTSEGASYKNRAVFRASWRPVMSPVNVAGTKGGQRGEFAAFDLYRIERVVPDPRQADKPGTLEYWLKYFDDNPRQRYVSDGEPSVVCVPKGLAKSIDAAKVKAQGKTLQLYSTSSLSTGKKPTASDIR